jgi:hypothetical protein
MPGERTTMRKVREVLRLRFDGGLSNRQIGKSCCLGKSTVNACQRQTDIVLFLAI